MINPKIAERKIPRSIVLAACRLWKKQRKVILEDRLQNTLFTLCF